MEILIILGVIGVSLVIYFAHKERQDKKRKRPIVPPVVDPIRLEFEKQLAFVRSHFDSIKSIKKLVIMINSVLKRFDFYADYQSKVDELINDYKKYKKENAVVGNN